MKVFLAKLIFIFAASALVLPGCSTGGEGDAKNSNNQNQANAANESSVNTTASDDVEELSKKIRLPFEPEEVAWRESNEDVKQKKITAVLRFSAKDSQAISEQAGQYNNAQSAAAIDAETWFPAELIAHSQLSGDETLRGTTYAANDFFQNEYNNGKLVRINDTNYFVLELSSN